MKFQFTETEEWTSVDLIPETPHEVASLFRMVHNSKRDKPELYLSFGSKEGSDVSANIFLKKIDSTAANFSTTISNQ